MRILFTFVCTHDCSVPRVAKEASCQETAEYSIVLTNQGSRRRFRAKNVHCFWLPKCNEGPTSKGVVEDAPLHQ